MNKFLIKYPQNKKGRCKDCNQKDIRWPVYPCRGCKKKKL